VKARWRLMNIEQAIKQLKKDKEAAISCRKIFSLPEEVIPTKHYDMAIEALRNEAALTLGELEKGKMYRSSSRDELEFKLDLNRILLVRKNGGDWEKAQNYFLTPLTNITFIPSEFYEEGEDEM
jgi:hypothetical protein